MRRLIDFMLAGSAGLLLLVPMLMIGLCIALTMGRPVLFTQPRCGIGRRPFRLIKFRSMTDARNSRGELLDDAARTTPFGRLLRRTRLDELPELWNVLRGDMSLIGPRPLLPATVEAMGSAGQERCAIRPGLTGWAQVNGNALLGDTDKVALDLWYIRNRSVLRDLQIVWRTIAVMIFGERVRTAELERAYAGGHRRGG